MAVDENDKIYEARKLRYQQLQENRRAAATLATEYGRWLIASLLLVHGASLLLLGRDVTSQGADILRAVYWWQIVGLVSAFACGFAAWMNCYKHLELYDLVAPDMIYNDESWPKFDPQLLRQINLTFRASILLGFVSLGCLIGASVAAYRAMSADGAI